MFRKGATVLQRLVRWFAITIAALLGLAALAAVVVYGVSEAQLRKIYQIDVAPPAIPSDAARIERGRLLVRAVSMCAVCHSASPEVQTLAGTLFLDFPPARRGAPNLPRGGGGVGGSYTAA